MNPKLNQTRMGLNSGSSDLNEAHGLNLGVGLITELPVVCASECYNKGYDYEH